MIGYSTIMENVSTLAPVKQITKVLLRDFEQRYEPGDEYGKVNYTSRPEVHRLHEEVSILVSVLPFSSQPFWTHIPKANSMVSK